MSLIITMMRIPEGINTVMDYPTNHEPEPLGTRAEVISIIKELFPDADASDPTWIIVPSYSSTEIILGNDDPVYSIGLRSASREMIQHIYQRTGWRGLHPSTGQIVPPFSDD